MSKAIALLILLALAGILRAEPVEPAEGTAAVKCPRKPVAGTPLFFKLKKPVKEHGKAARAILHERFPCLVFWCTRKGEMFAYLSDRDAVKLLGGHVVHTSGRGMGNDVNANASFVDIRPESFVPELVKDHVARMRFDDDPKFDYTGPDARKCE